MAGIAEAALQRRDLRRGRGLGQDGLDPLAERGEMGRKRLRGRPVGPRQVGPELGSAATRSNSKVMTSKPIG